VSNLVEIQQAALGLSDDERAILMAKLWDSLPQLEVDDDAVEWRLRNLADNPASEISHDEFIRQVEKERSSGM
jgi:hypothetical protein